MLCRIKGCTSVALHCLDAVKALSAVGDLVGFSGSQSVCIKLISNSGCINVKSAFPRVCDKMPFLKVLLHRVHISCHEACSVTIGAVC